MTNPHDKAIEAAAEALWEFADDEVGWEASKADPKMEPQIEWTLESIRAAIAAYERAMPRRGDPATEILGWREMDWPEGFDRRTAEIMANEFARRWRSSLPQGRNCPPPSPPTVPEGE